MDKEVLGLIPARGGSKGIPKKNIKLLKGQPLIKYTIEEAKKSNFINRVIVSTDDLEIAKVSQDCGAETPFIRPKELAKDDTPSSAVIIHALNWLKENEGYFPEFFIMLQPTSPFRTAGDIDSAFNSLIKKNAGFIVSVCQTKESPYLMQVINKDGFLKPVVEKEKIKRRQELPTTYLLNGAIYVAKAQNFLKEKSFICDETLPYIMPRDQSLDIDSFDDWKLAELKMEG